MLTSVQSTRRVQGTSMLDGFLRSFASIVSPISHMIRVAAFLIFLTFHFVNEIEMFEDLHSVEDCLIRKKKRTRVSLMSSVTVRRNENVQIRALDTTATTELVSLIHDLR